jgi:squalene-hopene/tetraprenyl-beta-curcumene cyclase
MEHKNLNNQYLELVKQLRSELNDEGFWSGKLSSSALATAVSIVTFKLNNEIPDNKLIEHGLEWLFANTNSDGGFGDTPESNSNVNTSLLCYAAITYCGEGDARQSEALSRIDNYLFQQKIDLKKGDITASILAFYGNDFTFSVPILSMLIICGVLDEKAAKKIPQLPFELSLLPATWYSRINLHVVSYAVPALIAVGIFIFRKRRFHNPVMAWIRNKSIQPALKKLERIIPESGGFLEAIPLTAFVDMCLLSCGLKENETIIKGLAFLRNLQRPDGSWPIDTDLSTWVTTLSIKAVGNQMTNQFSNFETEKLSAHLKAIQYKEKHPFNLAQPGGWGWTNFSGSVPDVDDTSGAIIALLTIYKSDIELDEAIINGCRWLVSLQNKDGGYPTFCKGWGRLPFDSSCADLTGHALLALTKSLNTLGEKMHPELKNSISLCISRSFGFLWKAQNDDGSWVPLWFGNQFTANKKNPVYGTAKVIIYLSDSLMCNILDDNLKNNIGKMISNARQYLRRQQNKNGSWGGEIDMPGTIEESSLAVSALIGEDEDAVLKGFAWLQKEAEDNGLRSNPIGLYFAMLWYDEKLYPLIYYIEALRRYLY